MRQNVEGVLNVYREHSGRNTLSATLKVGDQTYYYHTCPKCFSDLNMNYGRVNVTINDDGSRPNKVTLLEIIP